MEPLTTAISSGNLSLVEEIFSVPSVSINRVSAVGDHPLKLACELGQTAIVRYLLTHEDIDVNNVSPIGITPLSFACQKGHVEVVKLLLDDPRVDLNLPSRVGATPFDFACEKGQAGVVALMLLDLRVNINQPNDMGGSPIWLASQNGHLQVVQKLLVCGRDINLKIKSSSGPDGWRNKTAAEVARWAVTAAKFWFENPQDVKRREVNCPVIADLLESFEHDAASVRRQIMELPELRGLFIGVVFAQVIFLSDNFVQLKPDVPADARSFFTVAAALPIELQMVLCNRLFSSPKDVVLTKFSEPAFREFANMQWS